MNSIDYKLVDEFLSNFKNDTIPIRFIEHISLIYKDGSEKQIDGEKIRKMFPNQPSARYNIIQHQHDISSMEVHIDKNLVYMYLLEIDKAIRYAIDDGCKSLKKKAD